MSSPTAIHALARALDAEDYETARAQLADDCVYEFRGETIRGADTIIDTYRTNGEAGRAEFDRIEYRSEVSALAPDRARIHYTDLITHRGDTHVHRCAQVAEVDPSGLVSRLIHEDLPGEVESLAAFRSRLGRGT